MRATALHKLLAASLFIHVAVVALDVVDHGLAGLGSGWYQRTMMLAAGALCIYTAICLVRGGDWDFVFCLIFYCAQVFPRYPLEDHWFSSDFGLNLYVFPPDDPRPYNISWSAALFAALSLYGLWRVYAQRRRLKKEIELIHQRWSSRQSE